MKAWLLAAKPASIPKILLPVLLGCTLAVSNTESSRLYIIYAVLYAIFIQLFIVFINDYADKEADKIHTEEFPHLIDRRVIPLGLLSEKVVLITGIAVFLANVGVGIMLFFHGRESATALIIISHLLLVIYSLPPLRLNYRGFGEMAETVGVGIILPYVSYYITGGIFLEKIYLLIPLSFLAFAGALSSGIKHEKADRITGKRTMSVLFGIPIAIKLIIFSMLATIGISVLFIALGLYPVGTIGGVVILSLYSIKMLTREKSTQMLHLPALKKFKNALHSGMYYFYYCLAISFLFSTLF